MSDIFFIIGCVRSATTAYAQILGTARNAEVFIEQEPKLLVESRELLKGNLQDPISTLRQAKDVRIQAVLDKGLKFGDKNTSYMPFIPYLTTIWDSKIVFLIRDGRDVVRSLMDWHRFRHPIFCMHEDDDKSELRKPEQAIWDYSRFRPNPEDPIFNRWKQMDVFEKAAWHWANYNAMALDHLSQLDPSRWIQIDVNRASIKDVKKCFDFLGLNGFNKHNVSEILYTRINRFNDGLKDADRFTHWKYWDLEELQKFEKFAGEVMSKLAYG